jgi:glycosyltransferase involved in cell wall biosynthesis
VKRALVVVSYDGIGFVYSGVGKVVDEFFSNFGALKSASAAFRGLDLFAVTPEYRRCPEFDPRQFEHIRSICRENGGDVYCITSFSDGKSLANIWNSPFAKWATDHPSNAQWDALATTTDTIINRLCETYDEVFVVAHHVMFLAVGERLFAPEKVRILFTMHSFGKQLIEPEPDYEGYERHHLMRATAAGDYFASVGAHATTLLTAYGLPRDRIISIPNGFNKRPLPTAPEALMARFGIPQEKKIVFTWGRCDPFKRFHDTVDAFALLPKNVASELALVVLCPVQIGHTDYLDLLREKAKAAAGQVIIIDQHSDDLPLTLLDHRATIATVFTSELELAPLVAREALMYRNDELVIIYGDAPYYDVLFGKPRTVRLPVAHPSDISQAIASVFQGNVSDSRPFDAARELSFVKNALPGYEAFLTGKVRAATS